MIIQDICRNEWVNQITCSYIPQEVITSINLSKMSILGSIPSTLGQLEYLTLINLENNFLTGSIPETFDSLHRLKILKLGYNALTGTIPHLLCKLSSLEYVDLSGNIDLLASSSSCFINAIVSNEKLPSQLVQERYLVGTTSKPTADPTVNPSYLPTVRPTKQPQTRRPTEVPSVYPSSFFPTGLPTSLPTSNPTGNPTAIPTRAPSKKPSKIPSIRPSRSPTILPTPRPSVVPSLLPSSYPSTSQFNKLSQHQTESTSDMEAFSHALPSSEYFTFTNFPTSIRLVAAAGSANLILDNPEKSIPIFCGSAVGCIILVWAKIVVDERDEMNSEDDIVVDVKGETYKEVQKPSAKTTYAETVIGFITRQKRTKANIIHPQIFTDVIVESNDDNRSISSYEIEKEKMVDEHFNIASNCALKTDPKHLLLRLKKDISTHFKSVFGRSWESLVENAEVMNAAKACVELGVDHFGLAELWREAERSKQVVRLERGVYCGLLRRKTPKERGGGGGGRSGDNDDEVFCMNGFYGELRSQYVSAHSSVQYMELEWDDACLSWESFLRQVVGRKRGLHRSSEEEWYSSIHGILSREWESLGLDRAPVDGEDEDERAAVQVSLSAFEALVQRHIWLGRSLASDPFGWYLLLDDRLSVERLQLWTTNPIIDRRRVFDRMRDLGSADCVDVSLQLLNKISSPKNPKKRRPGPGLSGASSPSAIV
eukprot:gene8234-16932_t